jgi:4-amino-4-deoxy-L-arabinose transferase-like glycosyltransferase
MLQATGKVMEASRLIDSAGREILVSHSASSSLAPRQARLLLLAGCVILLFWGVGERGLWSAHEGRAAQNARNILDSNDWLIPRQFTGETETLNPPMYYWLVAVSAKIVGDINGFSIRLPSTVAATLGVLLVFSFGRRMYGLATGLLAAVILLTCTRYAWLARVGRIDLPGAVAIAYCLLAYWKSFVFFRDSHRKLPFTFHVSLAFAILTKGPLAVVMVVFPIAISEWSLRRSVPDPLPWFSFNTERWRIGAWILALLIPAAWFVHANIRTNGDLFEKYFAPSQWSWVDTGDSEISPGPVWYYPFRMCVDCLPWSLLFPAIVIRWWQQRGLPGRSPFDPNQRFLMGWLVSHVLLLSIIPIKRPDYILPALPALSLLMAGWLDTRAKIRHQTQQTTFARFGGRHTRFLAAMGLLLAATAAPLLFWGERQFARKGGLAKTIVNMDVLENHLNETDSFMMFAVERIMREQWPLLGIILPVLVVAVWLIHSGWFLGLNSRLALGLGIPWAVCFLIQTQVILPRLDGLRDMERFARTARRIATPARPIYYFGLMDPDLIFHGGKPARTIHEFDELARLAENEYPAFVVIKTSDLEQLKARGMLDRWRPIVNNCEYAQHRLPRSLMTNATKSTVFDPWSITDESYRR